MQQANYLKKLYENRFDPTQQREKRLLWKVLIDSFLQKYFSPSANVLDIGGGYCEFINQIKAKGKYLIDLNPDSKSFANPDVTVFNLDILDSVEQSKIPQGFFDCIFVSNFFEHLNNKEELIAILSFCFYRLKPGGSLLVIQPNYKYSFREYYDFVDHQLPITHLSLLELLKAIDFQVDEVIPRFLPFSTKGRPSSVLLLKIYLKLPILWNFLGGQMFIKASRPYGYLSKLELTADLD